MAIDHISWISWSRRAQHESWKVPRKNAGLHDGRQVLQHDRQNQRRNQSQNFDYGVPQVVYGTIFTGNIRKPIYFKGKAKSGWWFEPL